MGKEKMKIYSFEEILDEHLGEIGAPKRDKFEFNLQMELIGHMIKEARKKRDLTQEQLGKLVGVQKAQISKLEKSAKNITYATIVKVFEALDAKVELRVELSKKKFKREKAI